MCSSAAAFPVDIPQTATTPEVPVDFRTKHHIRLKGIEEEDYLPFLNFNDTPFMPAVQKVLTKAGYTEPTPIQAQAWPIAMAKRDMISVAKTGSGKTCAYLLPAIHELMVNKKENPSTEVSVFVLAPTRELCLQIMEQVSKYTGAAPEANQPTFSRHRGRGRDNRDQQLQQQGKSTTGINALALYGGSDRNKQIRTLQRRDTQIIVGTPGRCNDLMESGVLSLRNVKYVVLDEADRMLDMGFEPQISQLLQETDRERRQTLCFTATWPKEVQKLAMTYLKTPVQINIGESDLLTANSSIAQNIRFVEERDKLYELETLLGNLKEQYLTRQELKLSEGSGAGATQVPDAAPSFRGQNKFLTQRRTEPKVIIFSSRKAACDDVAFYLTSKGYNGVNSLHGDKSQGMRDRVMQAFRKGYCNYLVATDVAARGLDVSDIDVVVNMDMPQNIEDYVHRIGRTCRGNNTDGEAYTFFTKNDYKLGRDLVNVMKRSKQEVPVELQKYDTPERESYGHSRYGNSRGGGRNSYGRGGGGGGGYGRDRGNYGGGYGGGGGFGSRSGGGYDRGNQGYSNRYPGGNMSSEHIGRAIQNGGGDDDGGFRQGRNYRDSDRYSDRGYRGGGGGGRDSFRDGFSSGGRGGGDGGFRQRGNDRGSDREGSRRGAFNNNNNNNSRGGGNSRDYEYADSRDFPEAVSYFKKLDTQEK